MLRLTDYVDSTERMEGPPPSRDSFAAESDQLPSSSSSSLGLLLSSTASASTSSSSSAPASVPSTASRNILCAYCGLRADKQRRRCVTPKTATTPATYMHDNCYLDDLCLRKLGTARAKFLALKKKLESTCKFFRPYRIILFRRHVLNFIRLLAITH